MTTKSHSGTGMKTRFYFSDLQESTLHHRDKKRQEMQRSFPLYFVFLSHKRGFQCSNDLTINVLLLVRVFFFQEHSVVLVWLTLQVNAGSPLMCESHGRWHVYGIVNDKWNCKQEGILTRISAFRNWIDSIVSNRRFLWRDQHSWFVNCLVIFRRIQISLHLSSISILNHAKLQLTLLFRQLQVRAKFIRHLCVSLFAYTLIALCTHKKISTFQRPMVASKRLRICLEPLPLPTSPRTMMHYSTASGT